MVSPSELKRINLIQRLTDQMIERISPFVDSRRYVEKEAICEQGDDADMFYMLRSGKAILKVDVTEAVTISLGAIKPGFSFGWSALLNPDGLYTSSAVAAEPSEVFVIPGARLNELMADDPDMGFRIMYGTSKILENRLERRTNQFLKALARHIDLEGILS